MQEGKLHLLKLVQHRENETCLVLLRQLPFVFHRLLMGRDEPKKSRQKKKRKRIRTQEEEVVENPANAQGKFTQPHRCRAELSWTMHGTSDLSPD